MGETKLYNKMFCNSNRGLSRLPLYVASCMPLTSCVLLKFCWPPKSVEPQRSIGPWCPMDGSQIHVGSWSLFFNGIGIKLQNQNKFTWSAIHLLLIMVKKGSGIKLLEVNTCRHYLASFVCHLILFSVFLDISRKTLWWNMLMEWREWLM